MKLAAQTESAQAGSADLECAGKLVITPRQEDNGYVQLVNPETSRKAKPGG